MTTSKSSPARTTPEELQAELVFQPSPQVSLGVELELQILDRETAELAPGAVRILKGCEDDKLEGVSGEFLLSMLEVRTGVCANVAEVAESLFPRLQRVLNIAHSIGYDLAIGGTHPYGRAVMSAVYPDARYQRIQDRHGWMACQEPVFGLHIHVGVPGGDEAIGVINEVVEYLPHLLALSANSPMWQGTDTSYASARARMFPLAAHAGVPPQFSNWQGFRRYCEVMHEANIIQRTKDIYWDIRPRPRFGTIEFRIFDAPATLAWLLGLVAFTRCLAIDTLARLADRPPSEQADPYRLWLAQENRWLASRYGLAANCLRRPGGKHATLLDDTDALFERLAPVAEKSGEAAYLAALQPLDKAETGAERQRRLYRDSGTWQAVIEDMKTRWVEELKQHKPAKVAKGA
jgi:carboxylate-amine ligase